MLPQEAGVSHAHAVAIAPAEQQLVGLFELAIKDQPDDVPSFISAQSITGTWFPIDNPAAAPTLSHIPWAQEYLYCPLLITAVVLRKASSEEDQLFGRLHTQTGGKGCTQPEEEIGRVAS